MHIIAPVKAGTIGGAQVMNNIHTIPARAVGDAVTMTNRSSQD